MTGFGLPNRLEGWLVSQLHHLLVEKDFS